MPKVSIIMPAYNSMPYIKESYESVMAQTYQDFELIITDDGSTDNFAEWSETIDDERVTVLRQQNAGASAARNKGIQIASGEYLAFLDADDIWYSTKLEKQVRLLDDNTNVGLVYTHVLSIDEHGKSRDKEYKYYQEGWVWRELLKENFLVCGSTPVIRAECFNKVGLFDTELKNCNDRDMWIRIARHYQFGVVPEVLVEYRQYDTSLSMQYGTREISINRFLTKASQDAPEDLHGRELDRIMRDAFSQSYNVMAWKPLQSERMSWKDAWQYYVKSIRRNPAYAFSKDSIRLAASLALIGVAGRDRYNALRNNVRKKLRS